MAGFSPLAPDDPKTVAGYALRAQLGAGGMGKVYLSFTPGGRPVAIKVVRPEYAEDDEFRRRFRQEIAAAQRVQGLYTAPVIDADADAPVPWLATAYVPGPSLHQAVSEYGPLPLRSVFRLLGGTAEALISIHAAGLVHRDLKPANVLLAEDGPRVIDFGIARAADATTLTRTGSRVGTPAFMAPEQIQGTSATSATDVFAVGQLAVWAACGRPAFGEGTTEVILFRIVSRPPDLGGCPTELRELVTRCLAKAPADRPQPTEIMQTCRALMAGHTMNLAESWLPPHLAQALAGYHTSAAPPPRADPQARPTRPAPARLVTPTEPAGPSGIPVAAVVMLVTIVAVAVLVSATVGAVMLSSNRSAGDGSAGTTRAPQITGDRGGGPGTSSFTGGSSPAPGGSPAAPKPKLAGMTRFTEAGFTIEIPNGWSRRTKAGDSSGSVYWDAPDGGTFLQVDPQSWDAPGTAKAQAEIADTAAHKSKSPFRGYSLIAISDLAYQDGAAADWEFTFDDSGGGGRVHSKDRFFRASGRPFALYLRAPDSSWSSVLDELDAFYRTFQAT